MSDDNQRPPGTPPPGEGATQLFNMKLDSWLTDFVADLHAPAGAPPVGAPGAPPEGAPGAPPAEDPYRASAPGPAAAAPYAPAPYAPGPYAAPAAYAAAPAPFAAPAPYAPPPAEAPLLRSASSGDAFGGPSPLALAPQGPGFPPAGQDPQFAGAPPQDPTASGAFAASAVPPIPAFAAGAVPPIPGLAGGAPQFEEPRRRWPVVLAVVLVLLAGGGGAAWFFYGAQLRALLHGLLPA